MKVSVLFKKDKCWRSYFDVKRLVANGLDIIMTEEGKGSTFLRIDDIVVLRLGKVIDDSESEAVRGYLHL